MLLQLPPYDLLIHPSSGTRPRVRSRLSKTTTVWPLSAGSGMAWASSRMTSNGRHWSTSSVAKLRFTTYVLSQVVCSFFAEGGHPALLRDGRLELDDHVNAGVQVPQYASFSFDFQKRPNVNTAQLRRSIMRYGCQFIHHYSHMFMTRAA